MFSIILRKNIPLAWSPRILFWINPSLYPACIHYLIVEISSRRFAPNDPQIDIGYYSYNLFPTCWWRGSQASQMWGEYITSPSVFCTELGQSLGSSFTLPANIDTNRRKYLEILVKLEIFYSRAGWWCIALLYSQHYSIQEIWSIFYSRYHPI